jgi:peptidyl-prolyl cis-trans isomerase B (cyclophilin B)
MTLFKIRIFLISAFVVVFMFSSVLDANLQSNVAQANSGGAIQLMVDHKQIQTNVPPQVLNGRTVAPLRVVFETLGAKVSYDSRNNLIIAKRGSTNIVLKLNDTQASVNGKQVKLEAPAVSFQGSTMVPLRFVTESFNAEINWDAAKRIISVYSQRLPLITIEMHDGKKIVLELYPKLAPNTVHNFISLVKKGYYNGIVFHRIIPGFMIQGGDPLGQGYGGPGYSIKGEFAANKVINQLKHTRGVLSMARSAAYDSAGSQFFIMVGNSPYLDGLYAAFGKVRSGMSTVDGIVTLPVETDTDRPVTPPTMKKVTVQTFGVFYPEPLKIIP